MKSEFMDVVSQNGVLGLISSASPRPSGGRSSPSSVNMSLAFQEMLWLFISGGAGLNFPAFGGIEAQGSPGLPVSDGDGRSMPGGEVTGDGSARLVPDGSPKTTDQLVSVGVPFLSSEPLKFVLPGESQMPLNLKGDEVRKTASPISNEGGAQSPKGTSPALSLPMPDQKVPGVFQEGLQKTLETAEISTGHSFPAVLDKKTVAGAAVPQGKTAGGKEKPVSAPEQKASLDKVILVQEVKVSSGKSTSTGSLTEDVQTGGKSKDEVDPGKTEISPQPFAQVEEAESGFGKDAGKPGVDTAKDSTSVHVAADTGVIPGNPTEKRDFAASDVVGVKDSREIARILSEKIDNGAQKAIELKLDPPNLGKVTAILSTKGDQIHVKFVAQEFETFRLLSDTWKELSSALSEKGLYLSGFMVDQGENFARREDGPLPGQNSASPRKVRTVADSGISLSEPQVTYPRGNFDYLA